MADTGIVRRIDDLGRIVIPKELRRTLGIKKNTPLSISVEDGRIVLEKHKDACVSCGTTEGELYRLSDRIICAVCVKEIEIRTP